MSAIPVESGHVDKTALTHDRPLAARAAASAETVIERAPSTARRLVSLDAYRGLVMVLMVSAGLRIPDVVRTFEKTPALNYKLTPIWKFLAFQTDHTTWVGCSLWDLIQPSFMFMVGAALAFSLASRRARGESFVRMLVHAIIRSIVLVALAIVLTSNWSSKTDWIFTNVLAQIGLGYTFLFLLAWLKPRWQLTAAIAILVLYWGLFAIYPKPPVDLNPSTVGLPADWHRLSGFASHWEKNSNIAANFDRWFLNRFPQSKGKPFEFNAGGYETLNFIPSLATMIFGLLAGELLRSRRSAAWKLCILFAAGAVGLYAGWALDWAGICPLVKRIWTPSWTLFSAGWAFLLLGCFYCIIDVWRIRAWSMPLVVVGMNSIAIYCMSMLLKPWAREATHRHLGANFFNMFGSTYAPIVDAGWFLLLCWLTCWWMYRQKIFVKI